MAHLIGESRPCFGEYKCPNCKRIWESSKAWRNYGQKCKHCCINVQATKLEQLFHYICESCFKQGFHGHWTYKLLQNGKACRTCGKNVKPCLTYSDFVRARKLWSTEEGGTQGSHIDPNLSHLQYLCEKCIRLGYSCTKTLVNGNANAYISSSGNVQLVKPDVWFEYNEMIPKSFSFQVFNAAVVQGNNEGLVAPKAEYRTFTNSYIGKLSYRDVAAKGIAPPPVIQSVHSNLSGNAGSQFPEIQKHDLIPFPMNHLSIMSNEIGGLADVTSKSWSKVVSSNNCSKSAPSEPIEMECRNTSQSDLNMESPPEKGLFHFEKENEFPPLVDDRSPASHDVRKSSKPHEITTLAKHGNRASDTFSLHVNDVPKTSNENCLRSADNDDLGLTDCKRRESELEPFKDSKIYRPNNNEAKSSEDCADKSKSRPEENYGNSKTRMIFIGVGVAAAAAFFLYRQWGK